MFTLATRIVGIRRYFPSNVTLAWLRSRTGLKWGVPAMMLALAYLALGYWLQAQSQAGGPGWWSLLAVVCAISAIKFAVFGPVSLVLLAAARIREARARHAVTREEATLHAA